MRSRRDDDDDDDDADADLWDGDGDDGADEGGDGSGDDAALIPCPACGDPIDDDSPHCPHCGHWITAEDDALPRRPTWVFVTAVVCLVVAIAVALLV
ncbi:MAG: hypothetical protein EBR86_13725 [Planctomycetia bacterium]|nr:hypothetical protein [Planctomycetia bacterium]